MHTNFQSRNLKVGSHLGDLGVDGRIILKWNIRQFGGMRMWTEFIRLRMGSVVGSCGYSNEPGLCFLRLHGISHGNDYRRSTTLKLIYT
jgi:hypothetical protein